MRRSKVFTREESTNYYSMVAVLFACLSVLDNSIKYLVYLAPLIILLDVYLYGAIFKGRIALAIPFIIIIVFGLLSLVLNDFSGRAIKEVIIISMISMSCLYRGGLTIEQISLIVFGALFFFGFINFIDGNELLQLNFIDSYSPFENVLGFALGPVVLVSLIQRKTAIFCVSLIFLVVSFKRIALIGVVLCFAYLCLPNKFKKFFFNYYFIIAVNLLCLCAIFVLSAGGLEALILSGTGKTSNAFSMGREAFYSIITAEILKSPEQFMFFGRGLGAGVELIQQVLGEEFLIHSDLLKMLFEIGFVPLLFFLILIYRPFIKSGHYFMMVFPMYFNILMISDNVFIYQFFWVIYIAAVSILLDGKGVYGLDPYQCYQRYRMLLR